MGDHVCFIFCPPLSCCHARTIGLVRSSHTRTHNKRDDFACYPDPAVGGDRESRLFDFAVRHGGPDADTIVVGLSAFPWLSWRTKADRKLEDLLYYTYSPDVTEFQQTRSRCLLDASLRLHARSSYRPFLCLPRPSSPLKLSCRTSVIIFLYCSTQSCARLVSETVLIPTNTPSPDEGSLLTGTA